jgi:glycosyltransferase involved in cell wall biosynthesis
VADRPLHIAIDGRELVGKPTGVGRYLTEVLRVWASDRSFRHRCTIVVPRDPPAAPFPQDARFTWYIEPGAAAGTVWEQTRLRARVAELAPDVFLAPGYTAPLFISVPFVLAVYDVSFFAHPEWFSTREGLRRRWVTRAAARRAHSVITISEFSAGEIVRWMGIARDRIRLAPPGAPAASPGAPPASSARAPLVLFVGSLFQRRRIPELMRAFASAAAATPARLILVGDNRTSPPLDPRTLAADLGVADRVDWRAYVADAELEALYGRARVFVFLSEYEGFGMTPLEAIAHGVPPILLDTTVAREVYGDAALYVSADPAAIASAMTTLLTNADAHAQLVAAGRARLARYSWPRTAGVVLDALAAAAR